MPSESLLKLRDELLTELAFAFDPVRRLFSDPDWQAQLHFIDHRYAIELDAVRYRVSVFCNEAQIANSQLARRANIAICELKDICRLFGSNMELAAKNAERSFDTARAVIRSLPCEDISTIFSAGSPFTAYCTIRTACRSATKRVELFDPYVDNTVFDRYLRDIDPAAKIAVVTETKRLTGDADTRDVIVAVSELLALERPTSYRLCAVASIHDRYARIDDVVYHLGGSLKDAAKNDPYTLSRTPSDAAIHKTLDDMIAGATDWFGPTMTKHRKT